MGLDRDDIGDELEGFEEARNIAQSIRPGIVRQELPDGEAHVVTCEVRDETGHIVYRSKSIYEGTRL